MLIQLFFKLTKLSCRASWIGSSASSYKTGLRTFIDELVPALAELQDLLSQAEDPYFQLKNVDLRAVKQCFGTKKCSHSSVFILTKLGLDKGQLLAKYGICATSGSKVMTRTINELKMRSQIGKVASVGF